MSHRSNFVYTVNIESMVLYITDLNMGGMSVTNNAEAILNRIRKDVGDGIEDMRVVYQDSSGHWDTIIPIWKLGVCEDVQFKHGI